MAKAKIYYARIGEFLTKKEKLAYLENLGHIGNVEWQEIKPDKNHNWLTEGFHKDFDKFISLGSKETKSAKGEVKSCFFKIYGRGVATSRDVWAYNFIRKELSANIQKIINNYNEQVIKWSRRNDSSIKIDDFIIYDDTQLSWSRDLKLDLKRGKFAEFSEVKLRHSLYRPFTCSFLFFDRILNEEVYVFPSIFPTPETEEENQVIWLKVGSEIPFFPLVVNRIPDLLPQGGSQCFPFYTYDEDGTNRRENITDWALEEYRNHYQDTTITKWDIFYYTYSVLHHPDYRERYAANLKRELPRIPFAPEFHPFAIAGKQLAEIHINYEKQPEYRLKHLENKDLPIDWRVEKMRLSKDKTQIKYNDFLTLTGIPPEAFTYRLGNRSALDWIIDQYQVTTDKRSGITNDPNRLDDEEYIVRLIKQVVTVSLETMKIVKSLPDLGLPKE
ncbi:helicase [Nodularia spumigena CS-591/04]|uniref:type ISP restriction/modification enzyme n=1 Tax=Nodularia spumigena TaxID=70799 RepID=UPI00232ACC49|nr:type ISP restriction/modification enzyme [Nodularia spumigena]MDB9323447.1 helicase [Nodularia spumigena CS-591/07A]MDB9332579.1 helicase [Nodularia spumigena CS-591/04]